MSSTETTSTQQLRLAQPERFPSGTLHLVSDHGLHVTNSEGNSSSAYSDSTNVSPDRAYEPQPAEFEPTVNEHPWPDNTPPQPENWLDGWREVPPLRPTNSNLDRSLRAQGFPYNIGAPVMISGCFIQASLSKIWQHTVQRLKPHYGDVPVGGEF